MPYPDSPYETDMLLAMYANAVGRPWGTKKPRQKKTPRRCVIPANNRPRCPFCRSTKIDPNNILSRCLSCGKPIKLS